VWVGVWGGVGGWRGGGEGGGGGGGGHEYSVPSTFMEIRSEVMKLYFIEFAQIERSRIKDTNRRGE